MKAALYTIRDNHYNCWFETMTYRLIYGSGTGHITLDAGKECDDPDFENGVETTDKPNWFKLIKGSNLHKKFNDIFYNHIASIWFFEDAVIGEYLGADNWDIALLDYHFFVLQKGDTKIKFIRHEGYFKSCDCDLPVDGTLIYQLQKALKRMLKI